MIKKLKEIDNGYFIKTDYFFFIFLPFYLFVFFTRKEQIEFKDFKSRKRKIQFISGRIVAKFTVCQYLKKNGEKAKYKEIEIEKAKNGKAYCSFKNKEVYLSISHTDGLSAATCGNFKYIGIDVEKKNRNIEKFIKKFLSEEEIEKTKNTSSIVLWCVKESVMKALGTGLSYSLKDIFIQDKKEEKFKVQLRGNFLSLFPEFENKEIEVKTFEKYNYFFAFCNIEKTTSKTVNFNS